MAEPTVRDLQAVLREHADDVLVPPPPLTEATRLAVAGRRRRALVATAIVAGLAALVAGVVVLAGPEQQPTRPTSPPSGTPSAPAVDELPAGAPTDVAYVVGRTLYVGRLTLSLEAPVRSLSQVGNEVLVGYDNGRLLLVRTSPIVLEPTVLAPDAESAVLSPAGEYVAYQRRTGDGSIVLVARQVYTGQELVQRVPGRTRCCDDPFVVDGITETGVIASRPAHDQVWSWPIGISGTGSLRAGGLRQVTGIDRATHANVDRVSGGHVVLTGSVKLVVGDVRGGRFVESSCCAAVRGLRTASYDLDDPRRERVAFVRDGTLAFRDLRTMEDVSIRLPSAEDGPVLRWEDDDHVLLVLEASTRSVLVRCSTRPRCESVADVGGQQILLAR